MKKYLALPIAMLSIQTFAVVSYPTPSVERTPASIFQPIQLYPNGIEILITPQGLANSPTLIPFITKQLPNGIAATSSGSTTTLSGSIADVRTNLTPPNGGTFTCQSLDQTFFGQGTTTANLIAQICASFEKLPNNPVGSLLPSIDITNTHYRAQFKDLKISTDAKLLQRYEQQNPAIRDPALLIVSLDLEDLDLTVGGLKLTDLNPNGTLHRPSLLNGLNASVSNVHAELGQGGPSAAKGNCNPVLTQSPPTHFSLSIPLLFWFNPAGQIQFQFPDQLNSVALALRQDGNDPLHALSFSLMVDPVSVSVGAQQNPNAVTLPFDSAFIGALVCSEVPVAISDLFGQVLQFANRQLPDTLSSLVNSDVTNLVDTPQTLQVPCISDPQAQGHCPGLTSQAPIRWGVKLSDAQENSQSNGIAIFANSYVEDATDKNLNQRTPISGKLQPARWTDAPAVPYDAALAADSDMANRLLLSLFDHGLFNHLPFAKAADPSATCSKGASGLNLVQDISLVAPAPQLTALTPADLQLLQSHLDPSVISDTGSIVRVDGTIAVQLKAFVRTSVTFTAFFQITSSADHKSVSVRLLYVDPSRVHGTGIFTGVVVTIIADQVVRDLNQSLVCQGGLSVAALPVPGIYGLGIQLLKVSIDPDTQRIQAFVNFQGP